MLAYDAVLGQFRQDNHGRLDALVDVALAVWWGKHDHARVALLREPVDAVVVALVEHPEFKLFEEVRTFGALLTT